MLRARGGPERRACAAAAPARNHQAAVSPCGCVIAGTAMLAAASAAGPPVLRGGAGVLAQAVRLASRAKLNTRCMGGGAGDVRASIANSKAIA